MSYTNADIRQIKYDNKLHNLLDFLEQNEVRIAFYSTAIRIAMETENPFLTLRENC